MHRFLFLLVVCSPLRALGWPTDNTLAAYCEPGSGDSLTSTNDVGWTLVTPDVFFVGVQGEITLTSTNETEFIGFLVRASSGSFILPDAGTGPISCTPEDSPSNAWTQQDNTLKVSPTTQFYPTDAGIVTFTYYVLTNNPTMYGPFYTYKSVQSTIVESPPPLIVESPPPLIVVPSPVESPPPVIVVPSPVESPPPVIVVPSPVESPPPVIVVPSPVESPPPVHGSPPPLIVVPSPDESPPPIHASPPPLIISPTPIASPPPVHNSPPPLIDSPMPDSSPPPLILSPTPVDYSPPPDIVSPPMVDASPPPSVSSPPPLTTYGYVNGVVSFSVSNSTTFGSTEIQTFESVMSDVLQLQGEGAVTVNEIDEYIDGTKIVLYTRGLKGLSASLKNVSVSFTVLFYKSSTYAVSINILHSTDSSFATNLQTQLVAHGVQVNETILVAITPYVIPTSASNSFWTKNMIILFASVGAAIVTVIVVTTVLVCVLKKPPPKKKISKKKFRKDVVDSDIGRSHSKRPKRQHV